MKKSKKIKFEKENTFFDRIKRKISDSFYVFSQRLYAKTHKNDAGKTRSMSSARRMDLIFYGTMIAIPILQWCIFYFAVNFNSFFLAFKQYSATGAYDWVGFENFRRVWADLTLKNSNLQNAFFNSLVAYGLSVLTQPLTIFLPYYIYKKMHGHEFFKVLLFLPSVLSGMVMCLLYQYVVDKVIPHIMLSYFNVEIPALLSETSTRFWAAWFYGFWFGLGGGVLLYTGTMSRIPVSVVEYAQLDGCGPFREFIYITFPLIFPTVSTFVILGFTDIFTGQLNLFTFFGTNSASVQTVGYYLYREVIASSGFDRYPYASSLGLFFTVFVAPLTILLRHVLNKVLPTVDY
ncbi:MAG: sugar ABC transporter permease [Clostridia bacterium]|nr:sugar ABC transporter permease [Clostridia bacterium]